MTGNRFSGRIPRTLRILRIPRTLRTLRTLRTILAATWACLASTAFAQEFPNRPLRIIVLTLPGGGPDLAARLLAQQMTPLLGKQIVVENRPGGGGIPGLQELLGQPSDGHTLAVPDSSHWGMLPVLRAELPYNTVRDFAPIGLIFTGPQFVVVLDSMPVNTLQEFIALARAKPGTLQMGSVGVGGLIYFYVETFKTSLGLDINHINYKGGADSVSALLRGEISSAAISLAAISSHVKSGRMKLLAVGTKARSRFAPDVPTVAEAAGIPDFDFAGQLGMIARAGTPKPIIDKLSDALQKAVLHPDVVARAAVAGLEMTPSTPEQLGDLIRSDLKKFAQAAKASGIKLQ